MFQARWESHDSTQFRIAGSRLHHRAQEAIAIAIAIVKAGCK
jgi:hypothetical protein